MVRPPRDIREFCRKVFVRLFEVPGNSRFLEYCITRRVLIDQLVYKYFLTDQTIFESYLAQTNPNERYLNKVIWETRAYLDEVIKESDLQSPLEVSDALYGVNKIWLMAAWQLKDVYRQYEMESCSFEINIKLFEQLIDHIERAIKPNLVALWSLTRSDPLNLRLLFPQAYKCRRARGCGPLLTWLTNPITAEESATNLFQCALLSQGFDSEDSSMPFLSLSDALRQLWRVKISDPNAELPVDPIELIPTSLLFSRDGSDDWSTSFSLMNKALNHHKKRPGTCLQELEAFGKDTSLSDREVDSMTIYLGLLLLSAELAPHSDQGGVEDGEERECSSFEKASLLNCHDLLGDWFSRLTLLIPDGITSEHLLMNH